MKTRNFFKNVREISKMARIGKPTHPIIRVCPICFIDSLSRQSTFLTFIVPATYTCNTCGYTGPIYAEVDFKDYPRLLEEMSTEIAINPPEMEEFDNDS
ncbi:MAG: hypothetical protein ACXAAT_01495 [Candidatus Hodarchaeales archaeon]|jgi:predicted RNA-binding Zn-ribbon protein involved in translation (DUF1610 family)